MAIQVTRSSMPPMNEYIEEISSLWDTHWLTNMGEKHNKLQEQLEEYLEVENVSLFTNGHLALENIIQSLDLTGEVITTPFTFISTTNAIKRNGLQPVFCDINHDDYTIDTEKIEELITDKTSAIVPVHVYGNICDVKSIERIAKEYNLKVIYDAAHAFGVKYRGVGIGEYGDASMFSFHATKVFNTIEGGAITYKNKRLTAKLNQIKNFGITGTETASFIGGNAKMNEFQAAMGICNLRYVDMEIEKRKIIVERYNRNLEGLKGIILNKEQQGVERNYSYYPILIDGYKKDRDEIYKILSNNDIKARKYFYPLVSDFESYNMEYDSNKTPIAKDIANKILTLPLYADLSLEEVDEICEIIKNSK